ncbi:hypothetical protein CYMTET_32835 [Cymbomonas tetramitiformis]|uniref:CBS domain-containing protein n=1 Tax=Cymbomonas tetramitiformis TaxID=36881 RepID=A0AAE0KRG3_9CHLO|nr:hypothetical protein CYMTET_32835 [Cymbomonas tetramitiformis]
MFTASSQSSLLQSCGHLSRHEDTILKSAVPWKCSVKASFTAPLKLFANRRTPTCARNFQVVAATENDDELSKEWPTSYSNFYEDITENLRPLLFLPEADPDKGVDSVMSTGLITTTPETMVSTIVSVFEEITGIPVLDADGGCIGMISKKDVSKKSVLEQIEEVSVEEVMNSPAITMHHSLLIADAAAIMLKHKIHRVPVVDDDGKVVGVCSRKDIFTALGQAA